MDDKTMVLLFGFVVMVVIMIGCHNTKQKEKRRFNHGVCINCGAKLRCYDMDSQGGRMYKCDRCGYYTDCSYDVDKGHY